MATFLLWHVRWPQAAAADDTPAGSSTGPLLSTGEVGTRSVLLDRPRGGRDEPGGRRALDKYEELAARRRRAQIAARHALGG